MIERLGQILKEGGRVVFFGGAGVSTESGIPDFRSEQGLYSAREQYGASPEELLSHRFFLSHPDIFFRYYKENLIHASALPNAAHKALAELERQGKLTAVVTQNIDGLHQKAGSKTVHELHGSVFRNYCLLCGVKYPLDYILNPANCVDQNGLETQIPRCRACGGTVRPDVVLYEEGLDSNVINAAVQAISCADILIVGGTSLAVYPAAGLLRYYRGKSLILINKSTTPYDDQANLVIHDSIGTVLSQVI